MKQDKQYLDQELKKIMRLQTAATVIPQAGLIEHLISYFLLRIAIQFDFQCVEEVYVLPIFTLIIYDAL